MGVESHTNRMCAMFNCSVPLGKTVIRNHIPIQKSIGRDTDAFIITRQRVPSQEDVAAEGKGILATHSRIGEHFLVV